MSVSYLCAVGIDLGTTYSSIGRFDNQENIFLFNDKVNSSQWIPSVVSYAKSGVKVGSLALDDQRKYPKDVIIDAKRMIGRYYNDDIIQELKKKWFFDIQASSDGGIEIKTSQGYKTPVEVIRDIIKYLLELAREHSEDKKITHAVISVPANYNTTQREETKKAAEMAGIEVVHLINEPTAGIISYWYSNCGKYSSNRGKKNVLTYDFGGGTLDVSLAQVVDENIDIVAVSGEMEVGGRDIDSNLVDYYLEDLGVTGLKKDMTKDGRVGERARTCMRKIIDECQKAKIAFSKFDKEITFDPDIDLERYDVDSSEITLTKKQYYEINQDIIDKLTRPLDNVFEDARNKSLNITKNNLTDVILIGGSSYNKFVTESLLSYFKKMPIRNNDPRNAVVKGAAIDARRRFVDNDDSSSLPEINNLEVAEICPLSLGIGLVGSRFSAMIEKGSKIPISKEKTIVTVRNYQDKHTFRIYETERVMITKESFRGSLTLDIPSKQAREVKMKLKLALDEDGILHTSAWVDGDSLTYYSENIIRDRKKYSQEEINEFVRIAEEKREEDTKTTDERRLQGLWNTLHENVIIFIEKFRPEIKKSSIKNKFDEIESIANDKKDETISSKDEYNLFVRRYINMFEEYNSTVSIFKRTNFLKPI